MYSNIGFYDPVYHKEWGEEKLIKFSNVVVRVKAILQPAATCYKDGVSSTLDVDVSTPIRPHASIVHPECQDQS